MHNVEESLEEEKLRIQRITELEAKYDACLQKLYDEGYEGTEAENLANDLVDSA
jgi:hypothetical protein